MYLKNVKCSLEFFALYTRIDFLKKEKKRRKKKQLLSWQKKYRREKQQNHEEKQKQKRGNTSFPIILLKFLGSDKKLFTTLPLCYWLSLIRCYKVYDNLNVGLSYVDICSSDDTLFSHILRYNQWCFLVVMRCGDSLDCLNVKGSADWKD